MSIAFPPPKFPIIIFMKELNYEKFLSLGACHTFTVK
jgi:hypothetical protein